jgi:hypothetical protein
MKRRWLHPVVRQPSKEAIGPDSHTFLDTKIIKESQIWAGNMLTDSIKKPENGVFLPFPGNSMLHAEC